MGKSQMLGSLEEALQFVLCNKLEGDDLESMKHNISQFIFDVAANLTEAELLEEFNTPQQSVKLFIKYLEDIGAHKDAGFTIH